MKRLFVICSAIVAFGLISAQSSDEATAKNVWDLIHNQAYEFTWHYEPGAPPGFYRGNEPHGKVLRTFYNNIAYDAVEAKLGAFPVGSILVKENHITGHQSGEAGAEAAQDGSNRAVEDFVPNLEAITVMVKIAGYNPEAGNWFWAKYQPDGSLDAVGKPEGCIGCHGQVADNDYVFDASLK